MTQEGEGAFYVGNHTIGARVGVFGAERQPVVYLKVGDDRTVVLGYDTLCRVIDMLCGKKESLEEKIFTKERRES